MDDSTLTPTVLFIFAILQMGRRCQEQVDFRSISTKKPAKRKHNYCQNLTEVVDFSKIFYSNKQAKQNESNLILLNKTQSK